MTGKYAMLNYESWKKENWDWAHNQNDASALTGTSLSGHVTTLGVNGLLLPTSNVLCIGVGLGNWVNDASTLVHKVWALDISSRAAGKLLENVQFITEAKQLGTNKFDLALSLWVAPHMNDEDLQEQLNEVIRSLKSSGTFAIHYKEPLNPECAVDNKPGTSEESAVARAANMQRTRTTFSDMVDLAGGYVKKFTNERPSPFYQIVEVVAHIGKL